LKKQLPSPSQQIKFGKIFEQFYNHKLIKSEGFDWSQFVLALIGLRMHILADTYGHQGFAGVRSGAINDVYQFQYGTGPMTDPIYTNNAWEENFITKHTQK